MNYVEAIREAVQLGKMIKPVNNPNYYYKYYNIGNDGKTFSSYSTETNEFCGIFHLSDRCLVDAEWELWEIP